MNFNLRNFALWVIIVLLLLGLFTLFQNPTPRTTLPDIAFSQFLSEVDQGRVRDVLIQGSEIHGTYTDGRRFQTYAPGDQSWYPRLYSKGVSVTARPQHDVPWFVSLLVSWLPFLILIAIWASLSRRQTRALIENANRPREDVDSLKRRIDELQKRLDELSGTNKA